MFSCSLRWVFWKKTSRASECCVPSYSSPWAFCAVWRCGSDAALTVGPFSVNRPTSTPETSQTKNKFMTNILWMMPSTIYGLYWSSLMKIWCSTWMWMVDDAYCLQVLWYTCLCSVISWCFVIRKQWWHIVRALIIQHICPGFSSLLCATLYMFLD